jgi:hypothetical protein
VTKPAAVKIEPWDAQMEALREIGRLLYSRGWSEALPS